VRKTYSEKLKDPQWQKRRLEIMGRDQFRCTLCYDDQSTLHVHHKHYKSGHEPWEYQDHELVTVCETCHETAHGFSDKLKDACAYFDLDGPWSMSALIALISGFRDECEKARGRPMLLKDNAGESPEHYVAGYIASQLAEADKGLPSEWLNKLFFLMDLIHAKGPTWVIEALRKAEKESE
jgi:hypothetical protein